jgi:hypothetical protein
VTCTAPKVATFNATSKTWGCLVPLGFNRSRFVK